MATKAINNYHGVTIYAAADGAPHCYTLDENGEDSVFDITRIAHYRTDESDVWNLVQMIDDEILPNKRAAELHFRNLTKREGTGEDDLYEASESKIGRCPVCDAEIEEYGELELLDSSVGYPYTCSNCGVIGKEWALLQFDGHTIR